MLDAAAHRGLGKQRHPWGWGFNRREGWEGVETGSNGLKHGPFVAGQLQQHVSGRRLVP